MAVDEKQEMFKQIGLFFAHLNALVGDTRKLLAEETARHGR